MGGENSYFATAMEALKEHIAVGMRFHGASVKREASDLATDFDEHRRCTSGRAVTRDGYGGPDAERA